MASLPKKGAGFDVGATEDTFVFANERPMWLLVFRTCRAL